MLKTARVVWLRQNVANNIPKKCCPQKVQHFLAQNRTQCFDARYSRLQSTFIRGDDFKVTNRETAFDQVRRADPVLGSLLEEIHQATERGGQYNLELSIINYPYGAKVMNEGVMLDASGKPLSEDYLVDGATSLGVVTKGTLDVVDGNPVTAGNMTAPPISLAQLGTGDLVGAFETLDRFESIDHFGAADWTIFSGINCQQPTVDLCKQTRFRRLTKTHGDAIVFNEFEKIPLLGQQVSKFIDSVPEIGKWQASLVIFNESWVELIFGKLPDPSLELSILHLRTLLFNKAWRAVTNTRNINSTSKKYLYSDQNQGAANRTRVNRAYRLFEVILDVALGRKPVFAPCPPNSETAPNKYICETFLKSAGIECRMMQPQFLSKELRVGYIPFVYLLPEFLATAKAKAESLDTLKEALSKIVMAANDLADSAGDEMRATPHLRKFPELVGCMSVQTAGERGAKNYHRFDLNNGISALRIEEEEFFSDLPHDDFKQWKYFSHCLKINLDGCSW